MLIIKPIENKDDQKRICGECGVVYRADAMAYSAEDDGKLIGICQFGIGDGEGYVYDLCCVPGVDDFEALFIMGRQTLNFIDLSGTHKAVFCGDESRLTKAIGFKSKDGALVFDLEGFFESPCSHKK